MSIIPGSATRSCTIIEGNTIQANNNANTPANKAIAPVGTGIQIVGGEYDTVARNVISEELEGITSSSGDKFEEKFRELIAKVSSRKI